MLELHHSTACKADELTATIFTPTHTHTHTHTCTHTHVHIHVYSICGQHAVSFFLNSSAQHRENEAEPDSNGNKNFQSGPNVPCQSAQTDKSVSSACMYNSTGMLVHAGGHYQKLGIWLSLETETQKKSWKDWLLNSSTTDTPPRKMCPPPPTHSYAHHTAVCTQYAHITARTHTCTHARTYITFVILVHCHCHKLECGSPLGRGE